MGTTVGCGAALLLALLSLGCTSTSTGTTDLAMSDMDAAAPPDLASPADLSPAPDLAPYPDPLAGTGPVSRVSPQVFQFTEGPVWRASLGVLVFSDIPANTLYTLSPPSTITPFRGMSNGANGNAVDPAGLLLTCEGNAHRVTRTLGSGTIEPLASSYQGKLLNSPNDLIARSDGTLYFTDPDYGAADPMDRQPFEAVFRRSPQGVLDAVDTTLTRPNGIALSPDETTLYVADEPSAVLYRYPVLGDGSTGTRAKLADTAATPDGMAVDDAGNLYLATQAGVQVLRPDGAAIGTLLVPEQPANCTFGGADRRTLYITARQGLYQVQLNVPGLP